MSNTTRKLKGGFGYLTSWFSSSSNQTEQKPKVFNALTGLTMNDINDNATLDKLVKSGILSETKIRMIKENENKLIQPTSIPNTNTSQNNQYKNIQGGRRKLKRTKRRGYK